MATTIYGKIDCYSDIVGSAIDIGHRIPNESYVQAYKFMQYLETAGVVELYTMFSGSSTGAPFGVGYWDEASRFGNGPFSVWRWKPNATTGRSWDWYLMLQCTSGSTNFDTAVTQSQPTRTEENSATPGSSPVYFLGAAAFALDSSGNSVSPWSGSISTTGAAAKGNPVWTSGALGNTVHVFPRCNNASGTFSTTKQCASSLTRIITAGTRTAGRSRQHFFSDGDGFLMLQDANAVNGGAPTLAQTYNVYYFGPYTMIDAISQSNPGKVLGISGSKGFLSFGSRAENVESGTYTSNTTIPNEVVNGNVTATAAGRTGGVFANTDIGVRVLNLSYGNYHTTTYSPNRLINTGSVFDEKAMMVLSAEGVVNFNGMAGYLNTPLIRSVVGLQSHDVRADGLRAVFGATNTTTLQMASTPWSGSNSPGSNLTRDGINFTITNYSL